METLNMIELKDLVDGKVSLEDVKIKKYLGFIEKQQFVEDIKNICIIRDTDNKIVVDYVLKSMMMEFLFIKNYTNINLDVEEIVGYYDLMKENGIVDFVIEQINHSEITMLFGIIEDELAQELEISYKFEVIVDKFLNDLQVNFSPSKIEGWVKNLTKTLKNFSPDNYKQLQEMLKYSKGEDRSKSE